MPTRFPARAAFFPAIFAAFSAATVIGQCDPLWQAGPAAPGPLGAVYATALMPNGDLIAGGDFLAADTAATNRVARWDGTSWQALGTGVDFDVRAIAVMPNGDIVIGGNFLHAGGMAANHIARWDGTAWHALGLGVDGGVNALQVLPNGDLIAGGTFSHAGGLLASNIASWDGTTWSSLGTGPNGTVHCMALAANGDLLVGGDFLAAGGIASQSIAIWNGTSWAPGPVGIDFYSSVYDIQVLANNQYAVVGALTIANAQFQVALCNGPTIQPLSPPTGAYNALGVLANGDLVAGGYLPGATSAGLVARFDGSTWTTFGNAAPWRTFSFQLAPNGDLYAAGDRYDNAFTTGNAVARFDGSNWTMVGATPPPKVKALTTLRNGDVVIAGDFAALEGTAAANIIRWNGSAYAPLGLGTNGPVRSMCEARDGSLVVSGSFTTAGGGPANRIARWNGTSWATIGSGLSQPADGLAANASGQVLARIGTTLSWFDGLGWHPVTSYPGDVLAVVSTPEDDFLVGGTYLFEGSERFTNGTFSLLTIGMGNYQTFGIDADGKVLGAASQYAGVQRLIGNSWSPIGTSPFGMTTSIGLLPNGDVLAASYQVLTRFDGTDWVPLGAQSIVGNNGTRLLAAVGGRGDLFLAGGVELIDGDVHAGFAHARPACPASAIEFGTGCTGGAGPVTLTADNLPWIGGTFRSHAVGMTQDSLAVQLLGTQPTAVPLPGGAPGCSLLVAPLLLDLMLPIGGQVDAAFAVPRNPSLTGLSLRSQMVGLELSASLGILRITSSNAIDLQIGQL